MLGRQTEIKAGDLDGGLGAESHVRFLLSVRKENRSPLCSGKKPGGMLDGKRRALYMFFCHVIL